MMKKLKNITIAVYGMAMLLPFSLSAQQASMTIEGLSGQNMTIAGSTLYLPAGAYLTNTGNIYIATNQVVAGNVGTIITGLTGSRLHFLGANQLDATAPMAATLADLNGVTINGNISLYNPMNMELIDLAFGATTADGSANLTVSRRM